VINLASKRENEEAFWTGLTNGWGPPGASAYGVLEWFSPDTADELTWYQHDRSVLDTDIPGSNTDLQYSYNLGFVTSTFAFSSGFMGLGYYMAADVGYITANAILVGQATYGSGLILWSGLQSLGRFASRWALPVLFTMAALDLFGNIDEFTGDNAPA